MDDFRKLFPTINKRIQNSNRLSLSSSNLLNSKYRSSEKFTLKAVQNIHKDYFEC